MQWVAADLCAIENCLCQGSNPRLSCPNVIEWTQLLCPDVA